MSNEVTGSEPPPQAGLRAAVVGGWLFATGSLSYIVLPALVGGIAELPGFDDQDAGFIGAAQTFGSALGLLIPSLAMTRFRLPQTVATALAMVVATNLLSMLALGPLPLALVRFIAGASEGVLLGIGIGLVSSSGREGSDRRYATAVGAQFVTGAIVLYNLPIIFDLGEGIRGLLSVFLVGPALAPFLLRWVPARVEAGVASASGGSLHLVSKAVVLILLAFAFFYVANGGAWTYAERLGAASGITLESIGAALSLSMLGGIVGSGAAALLAKAVPRGVNLLLGSLCGILSSLLLVGDLDFPSFALAVFLINFSIGYVIPFYLALLAERDPTGRVGSFSYVLNMIASAVGPAIAASLVSLGYDVLLYSAAAVYAVGYLLVVPALRGPQEEAG